MIDLRLNCKVTISIRKCLKFHLVVTSMIAIAKRDHESQGDKDLVFNKGDIIHIISRSKNGNSIGVFDGSQGVVRDDDIEFVDENLPDSPIEVYYKSQNDVTDSTEAAIKIDKVGNSGNDKLQRDQAQTKKLSDLIDHDNEEIQKNVGKINGATSNDNASLVKDNVKGGLAKAEEANSDADKGRRKKRSIFSSSPLFKRQSSRSSLGKETVISNANQSDNRQESSIDAPTSPHNQF